ncbi:uncharacterized protein CXorf49 homolog [Mustela putorius furo]|uniref:Uncharacterized protein CXorf49 homolog n=1 Tax=Mustela putorius furo TaxID=9669 RepID=M3Y1N0_MUSPF|nr:uncharacterized protein CXorf49 homolog [Mustela putorius furo]
MSTPNEGSVWGAGFGPEGGEQAGVRPSGPGAPWAPRAPGVGLDVGLPRSGEGEGGFADAEGFESEREVLEAGGPVLWGREGRPGSRADDKGDAPDYAAHLADESAADIVQQLTDRDALGLRRNPSPESCAAEASGGWAGLDAGPSGRGALVLGRVESQPPSAAAGLRVAGPEGSRAWGNPRRGAKSRANARADRQRPSAATAATAEGLGAPLPSDPESSDEFGEIQLMRVSIYSKEGGQAKPSSPEDPGDTPRHSNFRIRENFLHVPGPFLTSAPRGFTSVVERQAIGELDMPSSKKMQSVVWGKGESRPTYRGATAVAATAAAAAGGLPRATSRRKVTQEKKSLGGPSRVTSGKSFPSWGQRVSAAPLEPATFPPISGVPLLGKSKKHSVGPWGIKQPKHTGAGKKSVARRTREAEVVASAGEGTDSSRDAFPKGQLPKQRPGPSCLCMHRGECSTGDLQARAPQVPGSSEPLAPSQGDVLPRGPAPSGDQEPLDQPPRPERQQPPPAGAQDCPRCLVLQREIDDLKEQLAAMRSLTDKFQSL